MSRTAVVTGAFSNTGAAVAAALVARGWTVRTFTNRIAPPGSSIATAPLQFHDRDALASFIDGADAVVNTYWIRFGHGDVGFDTAVADSRVLLDAATSAGVRRFVQVSVSNATLDSPLAYYRGKAQVDELVAAADVSHAIVRPTLIVGPQDVLTGNIAWFLRRSPVFALPAGDGYELQPVLVGDVGRILADAVESSTDLDIDAAGLHTYTFEAYVRLLASALGLRRAMPRLPVPVVLAALRAIGPFVRDTVLTREELLGLRDGLLVSHDPPLGTLDVGEWLHREASGFGRRWINDTHDRFARRAAGASPR